MVCCMGISEISRRTSAFCQRCMVWMEPERMEKAMVATARAGNHQFGTLSALRTHCVIPERHTN